MRRLEEKMGKAGGILTGGNLCIWYSCTCGVDVAFDGVSYYSTIVERGSC